jgi:hypothetical protein
MHEIRGKCSDVRTTRTIKSAHAIAAAALHFIPTRLNFRTPLQRCSA